MQQDVGTAGAGFANAKGMLIRLSDHPGTTDQRERAEAPRRDEKVVVTVSST